MEAFLKHLAEAIHQPGLEISPAERLVDLPNWDSLAILTILSMLDQQYGILASGPDIQACRTVEDLYKWTTGERQPKA